MGKIEEYEEELRKLREQKKQIESQIAILKQQSQVCGCAKLDKDHYATSKPDEWYIAVFQECCDEIDKKRGVKGRWRSIIRNPDMQKVIDGIDVVIADLQGLKEKIKENEHE